MRTELPPIIRSIADAELLYRLAREAAALQVSLGCRRIFEIPFKELRCFEKHFVELLLFTAGFCRSIDQLDTRFVGQYLQCSTEIGSIHLFNKGEDITLFAAAEAIICLPRWRNVKRRCL